MSSHSVSVKGTQIAVSSATVPLEGNHYFPPGALDMQYFSPSAAGTHTTCPAKGQASYYDVKVDGQTIKDAAWYYPQSRIANVAGFVAFYKNKVTVA